MLALLLLFLVTLVEVNAEGCNETTAKEFIAERLQEKELSPVINLIRTEFNCLSTSNKRGEYNFISISVQYTSSYNNITNEARYNLACDKVNGGWLRTHEDLSAPYMNGSRSDCSDCRNRTENDHHCTR